MESSQTKDWSHVPSIDRQIPVYCATRKSGAELVDDTSLVNVGLELRTRLLGGLRWALLPLFLCYWLALRPAALLLLHSTCVCRLFVIPASQVSSRWGKRRAVPWNWHKCSLSTNGSCLTSLNFFLIWQMKLNDNQILFFNWVRISNSYLIILCSKRHLFLSVLLWWEVAYVGSDIGNTIKVCESHWFICHFFSTWMICATKEEDEDAGSFRGVWHTRCLFAPRSPWLHLVTCPVLELFLGGTLWSFDFVLGCITQQPSLHTPLSH